MNTVQGPKAGKGSRIRIAALCAACLLINIAGAKLALALNLPLFLDIVGTALAAALGGFIPGIIVGFLTNLINGIGDLDTIYYGSLNVLIAVCSTVFAIRGYYSKWYRIPNGNAIVAAKAAGIARY